MVFGLLKPKGGCVLDYLASYWVSIRRSTARFSMCTMVDTGWEVFSDVRVTNSLWERLWLQMVTTDNSTNGCSGKSAYVDCAKATWLKTCCICTYAVAAGKTLATCARRQWLPKAKRRAFKTFASFCSIYRRFMHENFATRCGYWPGKTSFRFPSFLF
ncbi:hypothetical protein NPIL_676831 [Nephila pilipes]|uniref:Uncharacterized protein n=1 Tax=Nephila pilipes TaxID=299642 RepID=A0A8X6NMQ7_NEPPI|nr:hypothetical protein NPIL_676831 [Nephila pilipes]